MDSKGLTEAQRDFARTLAERYGLTIPCDVLYDAAFGKKFLDLFAWDPETDQTTGFRRVTIIESYLYYDKDIAHLQEKLELARADVAFMIKTLAEYKYDGAVPREKDEPERDPEEVYYEKLETAPPD